MTRLVALLVVFIFFGLMIWVVVDGTQDDMQRATEHTVYEGRVTAVVQTGSASVVYMNSEPKKITIYGGELELLVGAEYIITVDGNRSLVNAVIIEEGK